MRLKPIDPDDRIQLRDQDAHRPERAPTPDELKARLDAETHRISDLQRVFYADGRFALLIVLQGRDASGKDGTIRQVFSAVNPQGCEVTSFKAPSELESQHDFLWRVHLRVPARAMFGIFNRSHYEDVLVPRVHRTITRKVWTTRYRDINKFERMLTENGVVILKFFLHVSRAEQKKRLTDRLKDPTKNWKFRAGDVDDRARWNAYTAAYRDLLRECTTKWAPWYVVPADDKAVRNWLVARAIADRLERLDLHYPRVSPEVRAIKIK
jgi:PPK2 family polyphosphate:nucleotide phosphotransferase